MVPHSLHLSVFGCSATSDDRRPSALSGVSEAGLFFSAGAAGVGACAALPVLAGGAGVAGAPGGVSRGGAAAPPDGVARGCGDDPSDGVDRAAAFPGGVRRGAVTDISRDDCALGDGIFGVLAGVPPEGPTTDFRNS